MQSSQSSSSKSNANKAGFAERHPKLIIWITWLLRIAVGGTFIFSGFVKAIDPWGTLYKLEEYLNVMGLPLWHSIVVAGTFLLCSVEFVAGTMLLAGCYRKSSPWIVFAIMCVMLPLTLWIAVANPVADCGCFGDFLIISNWATFWKNVALMAGVIWLLKFNRYSRCIISPALQWIAFLATLIFIGYIEVEGYLFQPLIDFRPYKVGGPLLSKRKRRKATPLSMRKMV